MYRLTIRATDESVPPTLLHIMERQLAGGASKDKEKEKDRIVLSLGDH